jgi:chromosome segregation ATPase
LLCLWQVSLKKAHAEKDEASTLIRELKSEVAALQKKSVTVNDEAAAEARTLATALRAQLDGAKDELAAATAKCDALAVERVEMETQLQYARGSSSQQEELLKKARTSLLEANEELKEARKHQAKWKASAQAATVQMNEKAAEADSARKQAGRARAELVSANAERKKLADSLKDREKKTGKLSTELAQLRRELEAAQTQAAAAEAKARKAVSGEVAQLKERSSQAVATVNAKLALYQQLVYGLVPLLAAVIMYAASA